LPVIKKSLPKRNWCGQRAGCSGFRYCEEENGMTGQVVYSALGPKEVRQLQEVYERARAVKAKYPDSHLASKAAKKLIDAFEAVMHPGGAAFDEKWLSEAEPQGHA
jgi:hypothetical protein